MSKEAEILKICVAYHDKHICHKLRKSEGGGGGGGHVSQACQSYKK